MSESNGRCEFEHLDYCCPPKPLVNAGFSCTKALPMKEGDVAKKCGATDADLMTEEEWERWKQDGVKRMTRHGVDAIETQFAAQKKNYHGGLCTCDRFVNCHDCRDVFSFKQSEHDKEGWVRRKFFEWISTKIQSPSIYACEQKWEELRKGEP